MSDKILSKLILTLVIFSTFIVLVLYFVLLKVASDEIPFFFETVLPPIGKTIDLNFTKINSELNSFLKIPIIKVKAPIISVGLNSKGEMDIPKEPNEVAWYNLGPYPGEVGSAVIGGHYGWKDNMSAVFDNLNKLKIGDKIYFYDKNGIEITFVVRLISNYSEKDNTMEVFVSNDGKIHLNLITCGGTWNTLTKSYSNRLVIFTDKE